MKIMGTAAKIVLIGLGASLGSALCPTADGLQYDLVGQLSGWHREARDGDQRLYQAGLQYIPQVTLAQTLGAYNLVDLEASVQATALASRPRPEEEAQADLYRLKLRLATAQSETRIGLQKLNFGPGRLLRPLRWFDDLDPRDPLGLTDGVYALRFRYVTLNNSSLWLWGLYGNDEPKGTEILATEEASVELGGRLQLPLPRGEGAVSFHRRRVDGSSMMTTEFSQMPTPPNLLLDQKFTEYRSALDGRWDIEIGLWFEAVLQQQRWELLPNQWTKSMMLGGDYTIGLGNGLHVLCEHMATASSQEAAGWDEDRHVSAFSLSYPLGYLDNVQAIGYYSWEDEQYFQYLAWGRIWDNWILNLGLFRYPDSGAEDQRLEQGWGGSGYGGQMTVIFNH